MHPTCDLTRFQCFEVLVVDSLNNTLYFGNLSIIGHQAKKDSTISNLQGVINVENQVSSTSSQFHM